MAQSKDKAVTKNKREKKKKDRERETEREREQQTIVPLVNKNAQKSSRDMKQTK